MSTLYHTDEPPHLEILEELATDGRSLAELRRDCDRAVREIALLNLRVSELLAWWRGVKGEPFEAEEVTNG